MNELLVTLDTRRVSVEEALRDGQRTCPPGSVKMKEAQRLYRVAREGNNAFLQQLVLDLQQDDLQREKVYRARLQGAQEATDRLLKHLDERRCDGTPEQAKAIPLVVASLLPKLPDLMGWLGDFFARRREEAKQRRLDLVAALKAMKWSAWDEVLATTPAAEPPVKVAPAPATPSGIPLPATAPLIPAMPAPVTQAPPALASEPILMLETGLHTAAIRALSVDQAGTLALTASEDKTARLWDLSSGQLLRTFRPFVEAGKPGMLYACALSPDGKIAAFGGWTRPSGESHHQLLLVDTRTGEQLRSLAVGAQVVNFLAFSPDGQRLVIHLGGRLGLRVIRVADGTLLGLDADYDQPSYQGAFDAAGFYVATSDDGDLRRYDPSFKRLLKVPAPARHPFGLAFSPDGGLLALAYAESPRVDVLRTADLSLAYTPVTGTQPLGLVTWSPDGKTLHATGGQDFGHQANVLRSWQAAGRGDAEEHPLARATVSSLRVLPGGDLVMAAQDPLWGRLSPVGVFRFKVASSLVDLREAREQFRMATSDLAFNLPGRFPEATGLGFSLQNLALAPLAGLAPLVAPPQGLEDWRDSLQPSWKGGPLELEPFETSRCQGHSKLGWVLGTDWYLRAYGTGGQALWKRTLPAAAWSVASLLEGKLWVALLADGTYRGYRARDGQPVFSLFVAPDRRWVLWTAHGYYACSVGGENLMGWQVNRSDRAPDFFTVSHFRDRFYKPELMPLLLDTLDEALALQRLSPTAALSPTQSALPALGDLPPVLRILSPTGDEPLPGGSTPFQVSVRTYGDASVVKGFRVFLDGGRIPLSRGLRPQQAVREKDGTDSLFTVPVLLPARTVTVGLQAELDGGRLSALAERIVRVAPAAGAPAPTVEPPVLRILAVGVTRYADAKINLQFPAKDATDIAEFFQGQQGKLFKRVETRLLTDERATTAAILAAMDQLRDQARPGDVTLYFFSSHGGTTPQKKDYFLLSHDFGQGSWGVDGAQIKARLEATQGKAILLMDTCHSGSVLGQDRMRSMDRGFQITRFINELLQAGPGSVVISSSTGAQTSLESPLWNNGAFTKALREGLAGAADPQQTGRITTENLEAFLRARVADLTGGRQTPVAATSEHSHSFPIAVR